MTDKQLNELIQQRDENFKKLGQWQLQKKYYEDKIKNLGIAYAPALSIGSFVST